MPRRVDEEKSGHFELEVKLFQQFAADLLYCSTWEKACSYPLRDLARFTLRYSRASQLVE